MSTLYGISKFAIEGENADKVYKAVSNSYYFSKYADSLKMDYKEGLLLIEEKWANYPGFGCFVLPFLIGDDFYWSEISDENDEWRTNDKEGKYFKDFGA